VLPTGERPSTLDADRSTLLKVTLPRGNEHVAHSTPLVLLSLCREGEYALKADTPRGAGEEKRCSPRASAPTTTVDAGRATLLKVILPGGKGACCTLHTSRIIVAMQGK
jgi:hypothetical protein